MPHYHYEISLFLQGTEDSTLCLLADNQEAADTIVLAAVQNDEISSLIDDCLSSKTDLDYASVDYLTPEQAGGRETIHITRDKKCIFSNKPVLKFETLEELLRPSISYLESQLPGLSNERLIEQTTSAIAGLKKAISLYSIK